MSGRQGHIIHRLENASLKGSSDVSDLDVFVWKYVHNTSSVVCTQNQDFSNTPTKAEFGPHPGRTLFMALNQESYVTVAGRNFRSSLSYTTATFGRCTSLDLNVLDSKGRT